MIVQTVMERTLKKIGLYEKFVRVSDYASQSFIKYMIAHIFFGAFILAFTAFINFLNDFFSRMLYGRGGDVIGTMIVLGAIPIATVSMWCWTTVTVRYFFRKK